jgi:hypothetical protein
MVVAVTGPEAKEAASVLRRIMAAVERRELTASASFIAFLKGAATALEGLPNAPESASTELVYEEGSLPEGS